jgi:predicted  nucleic acid-binding Zn-ribbon protein
MSHLCRKCGKQMPKDRKGWEQLCPDCEQDEVPDETQSDLYGDRD